MPIASANRKSKQGGPVDHKDKPYHTPKSRSLLNASLEVVRNNMVKGVVALVTSAGCVGFFLSPLKEYAYHKIWPENATVLFNANQKPISLNDQFELNLIIMPKNIAISAGEISVSYPPDRLRLVEPSSGSIFTEGIAVNETKPEKLVFRALAHGPAVVHIYFTTKYSKTDVFTNLLVRDVDPNHHPSRENLTGTWNFRMGLRNGELHIQDDSGKIRGHYELDNGDIGEVKGVRGPAAFQVSLIDVRGHEYSVQCILNLADSFVELKGDYLDPKASKAKELFYASSLT